ncbi:hypothetical protein DFP72DRAFT_1127636 [Ephemerocybe angulata]|uniref:F-box domain-containing protein n=1 Tax=Ephemerocybe angulata TaxID=980116 RepID=A0A8H6HVE6_9AGAR|nr:hypothetical protein DFP72DRAFT_1127636 [Tulosesus angulatus]
MTSTSTMSSSPNIDDLPGELLEEVLIMSVPVRKEGFFSKFEKWRTNLRLVSRRWNKTILQNAAFWNVIRIDTSLSCDKLDDKAYRHYLSKLEQSRIAAQRSATVPRKLYLWDPAEYTKENETQILPGIIDIIHSISNWTSIHISSNRRLVRQIFPAEDAPSPTWPSLEAIFISTELDEAPLDDQGSNTTSPPLLVMSPERFPSLRIARLFLKQWSLKTCHLPWAQLTHLTLAVMQGPFSDYLRILEKCVSLESLSITVKSPIGRPFTASDSSSPLPFIALSKLKRLDLFLNSSSDIIVSFLWRLVLPSLTTLVLKVGAMVYHGHRFTHAILSLINWSGCTPSHLEIDLMLDTYIELEDEMDLATLLSTTPSLKTFRLGAAHIRGHFFDHLEDHSLPNLESIDIFSNYDYEFLKRMGAEAFLRWAMRWIQSNGGSGPGGVDGERRKPPFRAVYHAERDGYEPEDFYPRVHSAVERLQEEGWDVSLKTSRRCFKHKHQKFRRAIMHHIITV